MPVFVLIVLASANAAAAFALIVLTCVDNDPTWVFNVLNCGFVIAPICVLIQRPVIVLLFVLASSSELTRVLSELVATVRRPADVDAAFELLKIVVLMIPSDVLICRDKPREVLRISVFK